jgi:hypothetical protein
MKEERLFKEKEEYRMQLEDDLLKLKRNALINTKDKNMKKLRNQSI